MNIFNFKREEKENRRDVFKINNINMSDFKALLSASLGEIVTTEEAFAKYVKEDLPPFIDYETGIISFGRKQFPFQYIGMEDTTSKKWVWGSEKEYSIYLLKLLSEMKENNKTWNLDIFKKETLPLNDLYNGKNISTVVCGLKDKYSYYSIYDKVKKSTIYIAILGAPKEVFKSVDEKTFLRITEYCSQKYDIDHKIFVESYLLWNGNRYYWNSTSELIAHFNRDICFNFEMELDGTMRICDIGPVKK